MKTVWLVAALLLCVLPTCSQGNENDERWLARFAPLADGAWPDSPCAGRVAVTFEFNPAVDGQPVDGYALADECSVVIRSGLLPHRECLVLVHEYGHLAGREHTHDGGPMDPQREHYAPCDQPLPLPPRVVAADALGASPRQCHFIRNRDRKRVYHCGGWTVVVSVDASGKGVRASKPWITATTKRAFAAG